MVGGLTNPSQLDSRISALLAWFLESFKDPGYKLVVLPDTASGSDPWELSLEILPTTAFPLLVTSVTAAQETAA